MKVLFADTSFYVAIFSPQDALHARAKAPSPRRIRAASSTDQPNGIASLFEKSEVPTVGSCGREFPRITSRQG